jgi:enoyl-CoA hydratase/carnithine racemase
LNRPERKNAWTIPLQRRYLGLLEQCDQDPEVRAIVITGAGSTFCPGADTAELTEYTQTGDFNPEMAQIKQPDHFPLLVGKPMIAAINGACAGIGLMQTLMCDVRIAVTGARMTTAFARRGLPALHGSAWLLPRLIGLSRATELLLSGRTFLSDEAFSLGLVHQIVPSGAALDAALSYASDLAANCSPASIRTMKSQLRAAAGQDVVSSIAAGLELERAALASEDFAEGVRSFIERRPPRFPAPRLFFVGACAAQDACLAAGMLGLAYFAAVFDKREVEVVPEVGQHFGPEDAMRLVGAGPRREPAESGGDAVHVGIDREGISSHGEDEHAGGRLRADAGQGGEVFLDRLVIEFMQAAEVDPALAVTDRGQDLLDPARLLVRDAAAADGVGDLVHWRVQDLIPVREFGFELGEGTSGVEVGGVLGQHRRD